MSKICKKKISFSGFVKKNFGFFFSDLKKIWIFFFAAVQFFPDFFWKNIFYIKMTYFSCKYGFVFSRG